MLCDRCGSSAYVNVILDTGGLLSWCAHHYREHEQALFAYVISIQDDRHLLEA
ncbi:DUF7455 domain-containing protein [Arthrobacter crystallopoietes]|jgi:hypothetical protein|uniref:DUF7455 domain-containing protein n=1 Tax=Crystallibacter crystallopoietes TaxID=37928 RepID=UPI003D25CAA3